MLLNHDNHLLDRGMKEQEFDVRQDAYHDPWQPNSWQPYLAYWGCAWSAIFALINGLTVFFGKFKVSGFFTACGLRQLPLASVSILKPYRHQHSDFLHSVLCIQMHDGYQHCEPG